MSKKILLLLVMVVFSLLSINHADRRNSIREHPESPLYRLSLERTVSRLESEPQYPEERQTLPEKLTAAMIREAYAWGGTSSSTCGSTCGCPVNNPPVAYIDSISPNPAAENTAVTFSGHGEDPDTGDTIAGYEWRCETHNQQLSTAGSFLDSTLSVGEHNISFRVKDNHNAWSNKVYATLTVFAVDITTPVTFPVYVGKDDSLSLAATVTPSGLTGGTYTWSRMSGTGNGTFIPNMTTSAQTTEFTGTAAGDFQVQVEYALSGSTDASSSQPIYVFGADITLPATWPVTMEVGEALGVGAAVTPAEAGGGTFTWSRVEGSGTGEGTFSPNNVPYGSDISFTAATAGELDIKVTYALEGSSTDSAAEHITINADTTPPEITITSPADGFLTNQTQVDVSGTVYDLNLSQVKITVGVEELDAEVSGIYFTCNGMPLPTEGDNTITATATDDFAQSSSHSITVTRDTTPPSVSFNQYVILDAEPSDNNQVEKVEFSRDGSVKRILFVSPYQYRFPVEENAQSLHSTAYDEAGNSNDPETIDIQLIPNP